MVNGASVDDKALQGRRHDDHLTNLWRRPSREGKSLAAHPEPLRRFEGLGEVESDGAWPTISCDIGHGDGHVGKLDDFSNLRAV